MQLRGSFGITSDPMTYHRDGLSHVSWKTWRFGELQLLTHSGVMVGHHDA